MVNKLKRFAVNEEVIVGTIVTCDMAVVHYMTMRIGHRYLFVPVYNKHCVEDYGEYYYSN